MIMVMLMMMVLFQQVLDLGSMLQRTDDGVFAKFLPGGGDNGGLLIFLPEHMHALLDLLRRHGLGPADHDGGSVGHLILEEFPEILQIHLRLFSVNHRDPAADLNIRVPLYVLDGFHLSLIHI